MVDIEIHGLIIILTVTMLTSGYHCSTSSGGCLRSHQLPIACQINDI